MMDNALFETHDYPIGGKMVAGRSTLSPSYKLMVEDGNQNAIEQIKHELISQMARYMIEHKLVEFTYQDNVDGSRGIAVRAYLAPNDQVKILRLAQKLL